MSPNYKQRRELKHAEYNRLRSLNVGTKDMSARLGKGRCRQMIQKIK